MSLPPGIIERYEALRAPVLQAGRGGDPGGALLRRAGLLAWARAEQQRRPPQRVAPLPPPRGLIPDHLSVPLIQVLAGMILHCQPEVAQDV